MPPEAVDPHPVSIRVRRGRSILLVYAATMVVLHLWEIVGLATSDQFRFILPSLIRLSVGLALVFAIWKGHTWARFVLAAYCAWTVYANLNLIQQIPKMYANHDLNALGIVTLVIAYVPIAMSAVLSERITSLIYYRRDEREMAS